MQESLPTGNPERQGPTEPKKKPSIASSFVLHEKGAEGLQERRITPLMEEVRPENLVIERLAANIIRELSADRGRVRVPEAALQNTLTRAIIQGKVGNPEIFIRRVKEACLKNGRQLSQEVERIFVGVSANIKGIKQLIDEHVATKDPAYPKQLIGTNDRIDAAEQVDLVSLRYRTDADMGDEIDRVSLVQVKNREIDERSLSNIHRAHLDFYARLAGHKQVERSMRERSAEEDLMTGAVYERGMEISAPDKRFVFESEYFGDFVQRYLNSNHEGDLDDKIVSDCSVGLPMAMIKLRFRHPVSYPLFEAIGASSPIDARTAKKLRKSFHLLQTWAAASPPTLEELKEVQPRQPGTPSGLYLAASFESVVLHGSKVSRIPLASFGEAKGLTKK